MHVALSVLAYNLTRVMNIVGIKPLIAAIAAGNTTWALAAGADIPKAVLTRPRPFADVPRTRIQWIMPSSQPLTIIIRIPGAALSRSDLNASLGLQVDRYEPSSGGRMLRLILQITEINGPLLSTVSNQFAPSFRGWFPEVRLDAELGCYGLSPFVAAAAAGQALTDYCYN
jgi:hypothetical protein